MRPTRFIDHEEYEQLAREAGNTIEAYRLTNVSFDPNEWEKAETTVSIRVLFLNVIEPVLYFDKEKTGFVIAPVSEPLTYETARDMHIRKESPCYRLAAYGWSARESGLDDATFFFAEDTLSTFKKGQTATH